MSKYNFGEKSKEAKKIVGAGEWFKFQEGKNKIRILAVADDPLAYFWQGKKTILFTDETKHLFSGVDEEGNPKRPSVKFPAYILDREDGEIKKTELPFTIHKSISELQADEDYAFEDLPMPYDLTITYTEKESPMNKYSVIASPKREDVAEVVLQKLAELTPINEVREKIKEDKLAKIEKDGDDIPVHEGINENTINKEDIPF